MPTPYPFQSGATLTAAQMNSLSELPIRSITSSATALATDAYSRVIANGSAITYTLPNSTFGTAQVIEFHNINSTVATIAAGTGVTLNGADVLTVSQYQGGEIYFSSASNAIFFPTARTAGLSLITAQTSFSAVNSVSVSNCFTTKFDKYMVLLRWQNSSTGELAMQLQVGGVAAASNYNYQLLTSDNTSISGSRSTGQGNIRAGFSTNGAFPSLAVVTFDGPALAAQTNYIIDTTIAQTGATTVIGNRTSGNHTTATAYDGFLFFTAGGQTITGDYTIYGYGKTL